jgi:hypothetical protein
LEIRRSPLSCHPELRVRDPWEGKGLRDIAINLRIFSAFPNPKPLPDGEVGESANRERREPTARK